MSTVTSGPRTRRRAARLTPTRLYRVPPPLDVPPSAPARLVVLASGTGSLLAALLDAARGDWPGRVVAVGVDRDCPATQIAQDVGVPTFTVRLADHADRAAWDTALTEATAAHEPDLVVSAGFMKILGPQFLGMEIDIHRFRPVLGNITGGLSGPCVKPVAVRMVWQVAQAVHIPRDRARVATQLVRIGTDTLPIGALLSLFVFTVAVIVYMVIGNSVFFHRQEIEIIELVGGKKIFIY